MDIIRNRKTEPENWKQPDGNRDEGDNLDPLDYADAMDAAQNRLKISPALSQMDELDCHYDKDQRTLWTFMNPAGRPSFTLSLLHDFKNWQQGISESFGPDKTPLNFLVLGSRFHDVFCYGGDLDYFVQCIRDNDRAALVNYGRECVQILHRNFRSLDLPVITIGMVEGDALGGGFEALLSFDMIVAERGAKFGLPESMFGLFPGMGAHSFLSRKIGAAMADRMIMGGDTYSAEQLYDMGLVHTLFDKGTGKAAVDNLIKRESRRFDGLLGGSRAMQRAVDVSLQELEDIVELWADSALSLSEQNIRLMQRLVSAQTKLLDKNIETEKQFAPAKIQPSAPNAMAGLSGSAALPDEAKQRA